jgi:hypothetical protein
MKHISDKVVEKIKTHILNSINLFFFFLNRAVLRIMLKNIVNRGRPHMTIWGMSIACWITRNKNMHSEYVTFIAFLPQQWLNECALILRCTYFAYFAVIETEYFYRAVQTESISIIEPILIGPLNRRQYVYEVPSDGRLSYFRGRFQS